MMSRNRSVILLAGLALAVIWPQSARPAAALKNSWRGITPLRSSGADVARVLGAEADEPNAQTSGPFKVEDGEVTISYITPSLAKIYRAPASMVGKVFTIYFKPASQYGRADLDLTREFKRCTEERDRHFYYFVSDTGVAYRFTRGDDLVDTIIYQPTRVEVRRLAVNTECVF